MFKFISDSLFKIFWVNSLPRISFPPLIFREWKRRSKGWGKKREKHQFEKAHELVSFHTCWGLGCTCNSRYVPLTGN